MKDNLAEEALRKSLLLMKYDTSKTLTENKKITEGKDLLLEFEPLSTTAFIIYSLVAASAGGVTWYNTVTNAGDAPEKFKAALDGCKTLKATPTLDSDKILGIVDDIFNSINGIGTDEEKLMSALKSIPTPGDLCLVNTEYKNSKGRDMYDDIDGDIDGSDWVTYVWSPLYPMLKRTGEVITKIQTDLKQFGFNCLRADELANGKRELVYDKNGTPYLKLISDGVFYYMNSDGSLYNTNYVKLGYKLKCNGATSVIEGFNKNEKKKLSEFVIPKKQDGGGNSNTQTQRSSVVKQQQNLVSKGYFIGTSGPNKNGVDGIAGNKTKYAQHALDSGIDSATYNNNYKQQNPDLTQTIENLFGKQTPKEIPDNINPQPKDDSNNKKVQPKDDSNNKKVQVQKARVIKTINPNDW